MTSTHLHQTNLSWRQELQASFQLAWPLVIAQLVQMAFMTTDVVMMGWLGPKYLAAGTLATSLMSPLLHFGIGIMSAVAPLVAQAIGAGHSAKVQHIVQQGLWAAIIVTSILIAIIWNSERIFLLTGQDAANSALAAEYIHFAIWSFFGSFMFLALRHLMAAHGKSKAILVITIGGLLLNAIGNYALMFGNWGLPRLELMGAGITTTIVNLAMFIIAVVYVIKHRRFSGYKIFKQFWQPNCYQFKQIFKIGLPVGFMLTAESGLFAAATILIGLLGTNELAAHAIALQCASLAFMIPLGISQAATIRVGLAYGGKNTEGIRKAGWSSIFMGIAFMVSTCLAFLIFPETLIGFFLDPAIAENTIPFSLAISYLAIAGLFQLFDGAQVVSAGVLRGLSDTKTPMYIAILGYWALGLPVSYYCGFVLELGGQGVWMGLAAGLAIVAVILLLRFANRDRLGLTTLAK